MKPTLVILAAGVGTRYGGLKQLAGVGPSGEALLEYAAFDAWRAGFGRVVLVIRQETDAVFREHLDSRMARRIPISYVHQSMDAGGGVSAHRTKPWGTGHAVLSLESEVAGPFAVVNADDFYGFGSYETLAAFLAETPTGRRLAAVGYGLAETLPDSGAVSRALLEVDDKRRLSHVVEILEVWREGGRILYRTGEGEKRALVGNALVSMNMWGFTPELVAQLRLRFADFLTQFGRTPDSEFRLPDAIQTLVAEGLFEVEILRGGGEWCGMTFREDEDGVRSMIGSMIARGSYPSDLWA